MQLPFISDSHACLRFSASETGSEDAVRAVAVNASTADQASQQRQAGASRNSMGHLGVPQAGPTSTSAKGMAPSEQRRSPFTAAPSPGAASSQACIAAGGALSPPLGSDAVLQPAEHSRVPEENPTSQTADRASDSPGADGINAGWLPVSALLVQPSAPPQLAGLAQGMPATSLSHIDIDTYLADSRGPHCQQEAAVPALLTGGAASLGEQQEQVAAAPAQLQRTQGHHQEAPGPPQLPVPWGGAERRDDHHYHSEDVCLPQPAAASGALPDSWPVACRRSHAASPIPAGAGKRSGLRRPALRRRGRPHRHAAGPRRAAEACPRCQVPATA